MTIRPIPGRPTLVGMALAGAALLGVAGCTLQQDVGSCPVPPTRRVESIPKPPVSEQVQLWQPGHWDYSNGNYAWVPGQWVPRGNKSGEWFDGYWTRDAAPSPCRWVPAHWL